MLVEDENDWMHPPSLAVSEDTGRSRSAARWMAHSRLRIAAVEIGEARSLNEWTAAMADVLATMLGVEEHSIFLVDESSGGFSLLAFRTIHNAPEELLHPDSCAAELALRLAGRWSRPDCSRFAIPLRSDGRIAAVLVMHELLPQRCGLSADDLLLIDFLEFHALDGRTFLESD